jgi:hypothetical protein
LGHKEEQEAYGQERIFKNWFDGNIKRLTAKYPDLLGDIVGARGVRPRTHL